LYLCTPNFCTVAKSDKMFKIPFVGLKLGLHEYKFEITDTFFEEFEYSLVEKGQLEVDLILEKKERMLIANFSVSGVVTSDCDRCNSPMELTIKNKFQIIYAFGVDTIEDENLVVIHPDEFEINVKDPIYELITLALPNRKVHPVGECDEEMYQLVQQYTVNINEEEDDDFDDEDDDDEDDDDDDIDPKWSILKNLN
jgi:uncharacterized protein